MNFCRRHDKGKQWILRIVFSVNNRIKRPFIRKFSSANDRNEVATENVGNWPNYAIHHFLTKPPLDFVCPRQTHSPECSAFSAHAKRRRGVPPRPDERTRLQLKNPISNAQTFVAGGRRSGNHPCLQSNNHGHLREACRESQYPCGFQTLAKFCAQRSEHLLSPPHRHSLGLSPPQVPSNSGFRQLVEPSPRTRGN